MRFLSKSVKKYKKDKKDKAANPRLATVLGQTIRATASSRFRTSTKSKSDNENKVLNDSQVGRSKPTLIAASKSRPIGISSVSDTGTKSKSNTENKVLNDSQVGRSKPTLIAASKSRPIGISSVSDTGTKSKSDNENKVLNDSQVGRSKPTLIAASKNKSIDRSVSDTFEDWLQWDSQESFKIKKYKESGNKKLSLEGELKSPEEGDILPHLIKNDPDLIWLSLGDCKIGRDKYLAVIEALKSNTSLKFISLSFTGIDIHGCRAIKETLMVNQTLTSIDLKNNNIGDLGFVTIMDAMQNNHTISYLDLRRNRISGKAMHAMRNALHTNTTLQKVELRDNSIGNEGCRMIMEGLHENITLLNLSMASNNIHTDVLQDCMAFVKRNEIIHHHRTNVDFLGISYYVSIEGMAYRKPYLTWAFKDSTTIIDEAAKSIESFALVVFIDTLRSIIDSENSNTQTKLSDSFYSPTMLKMIRDKDQLRILLNQKINDDTYLHHMIAGSKHPRTLDMLKFLIDRCDACFYTLEDDKGLTARAIALTSEDDAQHAWANMHGTFLGRYIIEGGKGIKSNPVHKSAMSVVHFAHDITKMNNDPKYQVTIKIMRNEETYKRERQVRLNEGGSPLIFSSGEDIPISSNKYDTDSIVTLYRFHDEIDITGQHYQCLIFEKNGKNLNQIIDSELITGNNETTVSRYGRGLAKAIQHVHSKGVIHADIKPRKIIRASNDLLKLIDLDKSIARGEKLSKDCSSAFISPEIARALFGSKDQDAGSIQERIIKQHKKITKLDLFKKDDINAYNVADEKIQILLASKVAHENAEEPLHASTSLDIWGFGVIMYYLCIGQPLFLYNLNDNLATESEKNRLLTWQGLSRANLDKVCPAYLSESFRENTYIFLMKCLHINPAQRFQSMEEILDHDLFRDPLDNGNRKFSTIKPRGFTNTALLSINLHTDTFIKLINSTSSRIVPISRPVKNIVVSKTTDILSGLETSTFTTCARVRPILEHERNNKNFAACVAGQRIIGHPEAAYTEQVLVCTPKLSVRGIPKIEKKTFDFDYTFGYDSTNEQVYRLACEPLVNRCANGQIGVMLAYGQTGSGKTHTINGIMDHVIKAPTFFNSDTTLSFSYFEMIGTRITDCLACHQETSSTAPSASAVKIGESLDGRILMLGLSSHVITTSKELMELVERAKSSRATEPTSRNATSSRSHGIGILTCKNNDTGIEGQLYIIDLAGSERAADSTNHSKERMAETKAINTSLSSLKECIRARTMASKPGNKKVHVPYRRSKLTLLMKDIFDIGCPRVCSTVMLSMCSPLAVDISHTANTLKYASPLRVVIQSSIENSVQIKVDKRDPLLWTNAQVMMWLKDTFPAAVNEHCFVGVLSGAQICALPEKEWYSRIATAGGSDELAKEVYLAMWTMVSDAKTRQRRCDGSIITEEEEEKYRNNTIAAIKEKAAVWAEREKYL